MAPHHYGVFHHGRDTDSDSSVYYHPALIFLSLLIVCFCIMAPLFWMLWFMRGNDSRAVTEEQLRRPRNWMRVTITEQQRAAQQPIVQDPGEATRTTVTCDQTKLSKVAAKLRKVAISTQQAVVSKSQLLWKKVSRSLTNITRPTLRRRRRRSHSRAGVSIDLPIMRQPAWQKLASGSGTVIHLDTLGGVTQPTCADINAVPNVAEPSLHYQTRDGGSQTDLPGQHGGGIDGVADVGPHQPLAVTTIGLAMG